MIKLWWRRLVCVLKDHQPLSLVRWLPDEACMRVMCGRCGKELGHMHLPAVQSTKRESLH